MIQHLVINTDETTHKPIETIMAPLSSCQNLKSLRLYILHYRDSSSAPYWADFVQHFSFRQTRLALEMELPTFIRIHALDDNLAFGSNLTHLELDHFGLESTLSGVLNFPRLTHLLVSVTWGRHEHLLRYINSVLSVFKSSPLHLFVLIFNATDVPWDECIGPDAPDVDALCDMVNPWIVLADIYSAWQPIVPDMLLENVEHYLDDVRDNPYPTLPDIWEQAEELVRRRRAGSPK